MLQSQRNKETMKILNRLKQGGVPPGRGSVELLGDSSEELEEEELESESGGEGDIDDLALGELLQPIQQRGGRRGREGRRRKVRGPGNGPV